jgi:hypothetical protein
MRREIMSGRRAATASVAAVHPVGLDEHRDSSVVGHDSVVLVPVLLGAAGSGEDLTQQDAPALSVDVFERIVGADQLGRSFYSIAIRRGSHW